jgi:hypothetical protein
VPLALKAPMQAPPGVRVHRCGCNMAARSHQTAN